MWRYLEGLRWYRDGTEPYRLGSSQVHAWSVWISSLPEAGTNGSSPMIGGKEGERVEYLGRVGRCGGVKKQTWSRFPTVLCVTVWKKIEGAWLWFFLLLPWSIWLLPAQSQLSQEEQTLGIGTRDSKRPCNHIPRCDQALATDFLNKKVKKRSKCFQSLWFLPTNLQTFPHFNGN